MCYPYVPLDVSIGNINSRRAELTFAPRVRILPRIGTMQSLITHLIITWIWIQHDHVVANMDTFQNCPFITQFTYNMIHCDGQRIINGLH